MHCGNGKAGRLPLRTLLVERHKLPDECTAERWIMAGKVVVDGLRVDKPGYPVSIDADLRLKGQTKYAGRGGLKLEGALAAFGIDVTGRTALDAGASTGGFTDCLLHHGADRVYAVDAGHGMLAGRLRADPRVVNLERTNISDLALAGLRPAPSLATLDLSYLSLRTAVPVVAPLLRPDGELVCLVKPLFETRDATVRRSGHIATPGLYVTVLSDLIGALTDTELTVCGLVHSPITGRRGTVEFFLWIACASATAVRDVDVDAVVRRATEGGCRP